MAADDKQVCAMVPTDDQGSHLRSIAEDDANQNLIAAAPELLELLKEAAALMPLGTGIRARWLDRAGTVIAKAQL